MSFHRVVWTRFAKDAGFHARQRFRTRSLTIFRLFGQVEDTITKGNIRLDHQTSPNDLFYGTYHLSDEKLNADGNYGPLTGTTTKVRAQNFALNYTHIFGPNSLNNLKLGYNRLRAVDGIYQEGRRDIIGELGINGIERDPLNWGFPGFRLDFIQLLDDDTTPHQPARQSLPAA
jgi:hypothetical protein